MKYVFNDGGRLRAGYTGAASDCVTRSIAIATGKPYVEVYEYLNKLIGLSSVEKIRKSTASTGVYRETYEIMLRMMGWKYVIVWKPATDYLLESLPKGRLILSVHKHMTTLINGVVHDTFNPFESKTKRRILQGFYIKA